jgi:hypothetical protein
MIPEVLENEETRKRLQELEEIVAVLKDEIQWDVSVQRRAGVGYVAVVDYRRLIPEDEIPADFLVVRVTPFTEVGAVESEIVYSSEHIAIVPGKNGKYEILALDSALRRIAAERNVVIDAIALEVGYDSRSIEEFEALTRRTQTLEARVSPP